MSRNERVTSTIIYVRKKETKNKKWVKQTKQKREKLYIQKQTW